MSQFIKVFCRSLDPVTCAEVAEFIRIGVFVDSPSFRPQPSEAAAQEPNWERLEIIWSPAHRPVVLEHHGSMEEVRLAVDEAYDELPSGERPTALPDPNELRRYFSIELNPATATEDCWSMVDGIEGFLAQRLDGIVYAGGDGFFDSKLQRIAST